MFPRCSGHSTNSNVWGCTRRVLPEEAGASGDGAVISFLDPLSLAVLVPFLRLSRHVSQGHAATCPTHMTTNGNNFLTHSLTHARPHTQERTNTHRQTVLANIFTHAHQEASSKESEGSMWGSASTAFD